MPGENQSVDKADADATTVDAGQSNDSQKKESNPDPKRWAERSYIDQIAAERDEIKRELRELKGRATAAERDAAQKAGNVEEVRASFQREVEEVKADRDHWRGKFQEKALKSVVLSELSKVSVDPELAFMVLEKHFELAEAEGDYIPRVKNSTMSISEFAERQLADRPHLLKSKRVPGTGDRPTTSTAEGQEMTEAPGDFNSWTYKDKVEFMRKNPKLGAKIALRDLE